MVLKAVRISGPGGTVGSEGVGWLRLGNSVPPPLSDVEGVGMSAEVVDADDDLSVRELSLMFESITLELVSLFTEDSIFDGCAEDR